MALSIDDIIELVRNKQAELPNGQLVENQVAQFVEEMQGWIKNMDFSLPEGTTIIAYSGEANTDFAWEVAREVSTIAGDNAIYIRDTSPGELLNDPRMKRILKKMLGDVGYEMVCNGYDSSGKRIPGGGCGFGNNVQSLADFISGQFMQRASGTSSNIVVLVPKGVIQDKVFAVTELKQIFENKNFKTINGISKENLKAIYNTGEAGRNAVYDILQKTSQRALGDNLGVVDQAKSFYQEIGEYGILTETSSPYAITGCYDTNGSLIGIQLDEKGKGTIIEPPQGTVYKSEYTTDTYIDEAKMAELFGEDRYKNLSDYEKKQAADLSNKLDKFLNSTDSQDGTSKTTTVTETTAGDMNTKQSSTGNSNSTSDSGTKHTGSSDSDSTKSNTGESSDKTAGAQESSGGDDAGTKHTGTGDSNTGDDRTTKHTGTADADIKDTIDSKHTGVDGTSGKSSSSKDGTKVDLESESAKRYLAATGKTADDLNDIDKAMLKVANNFATNPKETSELAKSLGKYDDLMKVGEKVGGYVDVVCTTIFAAKAIYDASEAYKNGDTNSAIGIVAGALTEFAVSTIGGMAVTELIAPYLIGLGVTFGPVGYRKTMDS